MWELSFSSLDRVRLVRDEGSCRACIRTVARVTSAADTPDLVGFSLEGDRLRLIVTGNDRKTGYLRGALLRSLKHALDVPLGGPDVRLLTHRAHILGVLRHYVAPRSVEPHELPSALTSGSCAADLLGARHVPGIRLVTGAVLPRLRRRDILGWLGLPAVQPVTDAEVRRLGASRVASAAAFAACASPDEGRLDAPSVTARRLTACICADAGVPSSEVAHATGTTRRAARRLASTRPDEALQRSVRLRLAIEEAVRHRAMTRSA